MKILAAYQWYVGTGNTEVNGHIGRMLSEDGRGTDCGRERVLGFEHGIPLWKVYREEAQTIANKYGDSVKLYVRWDRDSEIIPFDKPEQVYQNRDRAKRILLVKCGISHVGAMSIANRHNDKPRAAEIWFVHTHIEHNRFLQAIKEGLYDEVRIIGQGHPTRSVERVIEDVIKTGTKITSPANIQARVLIAHKINERLNRPAA